MLEFEVAEIVSATDGRFVLRLPEAVSAAGVFLVLDVYDLHNDAHPEGHFGWWRFELEDSPELMEGKLAFEAGGIRLQVSGTAPTGSWVNDNPPTSRSARVIAELRDRTTESVVDSVDLPAFATAAERDAYRGTYSRDWSRPRFAVANHAVPRDATVRIVAANLAARDAVGNFCFDIHRLLLQNDIAVQLYAHNFELRYNDFVRRTRSLAADCRPGDTILYFHSTFDPHLEDVLAVRCARRIAYFHGLTEPSLIQRFDEELAAALRKGIAQTRELAAFDALGTNSRFNARRLVASFGAGSPWTAERISVVPPKLLPVDQVAQAPDNGGHRSAALLYVGRIHSHKRIEHLLALFRAYRDLQPDAECWVVGSVASQPYQEFLQRIETEQLDIPAGAVRWFGSVDEAELARLFSTASAYVSMSEDEGFCLPVLEAMLAGLPVFSRRLDAIDEVLAGTGVTFDGTDFEHLARVLHRTLSDEARRAEIVDRQRARAHELAATMTGLKVLDLLAAR